MNTYGTSRRRPSHRRAASERMSPAMTITPPNGSGPSRSSKPRPSHRRATSERFPPTKTTVSLEQTASRGSAKPRPSHLSASSDRATRIKRTAHLQNATQGVSTSATDTIANSFIRTLSDIAQNFLFPVAETPKKEPPRMKKKSPELSVTASTIDEEDDDEGHSFPNYENTDERYSLSTYETSEEWTVENYQSNAMSSSESSNRTPPPPLVGSDGSAFSPSNVPWNVHRPIPKSHRKLNPMFPVNQGSKSARIRAPSPQPPLGDSKSRTTSPEDICAMARMRAPPSPQPVSVARSEDAKSRKSTEELVAERHAKWRRHMKMHRQRDDDDSVMTTCAPTPRAKRPVEILQRLIRAPCAQVRDVMCDGEESSDDCSSSDDSSTDSSEAEENSIAEAPSLSAMSSRSSTRSTRSALRKVALKAPGSFPPISPAASSATESKESEQSGTKDKNFIQIFIQEMSEDGVMFIWHGPQSDSTAAFQRPCGVVAHLNLGSPRADDGVYEPPQLVWRRQDESDAGNIDLFDIKSLEIATRDMLSDFPFAIPGNSFFLELQNGSRVVFEAGSDATARRFVHGLRWVVARLSFNLVVGNPLVSCELLSLAGGNVLPQTPTEEALWSKAMNDVTNRLVDGMLNKT